MACSSYTGIHWLDLGGRDKSHAPHCTGVQILSISPQSFGNLILRDILTVRVHAPPSGKLDPATGIADKRGLWHSTEMLNLVSDSCYSVHSLSRINL